MKIDKRLVSILLAGGLALASAAPVTAYDSPLSEESIRDAYFLGTRNGGLSMDFLRPYSKLVPDLRQGTCTSSLRLETPFLRVARASQAPNYTAQDAVKEFFGRGLMLRLYLDVCYETSAPPNAVAVRVFQHKKALRPLTQESTPYAEPTDFGYLPPNGERITLEFSPNRIDSSSDLKIVLDTPNSQHAEISFNLQEVR